MQLRYLNPALALCAILVTASCVEEIPSDDLSVNPNLVEVTFAASVEEETKAGFSAESYPEIFWNANDEISVLGAKTGNQEKLFLPEYQDLSSQTH